MLNEKTQAKVVVGLPVAELTRIERRRRAGKTQRGSETPRDVLAAVLLSERTSPVTPPGAGDAGPVSAVVVDDCPSRIPTADVVASLMKYKRNKRLKEDSLATYEKRLETFVRQFPHLPESEEPIMEYLSRFDGESGRHRRNNQDLLGMLYRHAVRHFGLAKNPVESLERVQVTRKPVNVLSAVQIRMIDAAPQDLHERVALDLLLGHGWRQVEVRRILAEDVAGIADDLILCRGKERLETAPILPETADRLRQLAEGLSAGDHIFVARQARGGKRQPLGEDGMAQLVERLFRRTGMEAFTGHDLRRTFATVVALASKDEWLAMRLLRDQVPGMSNRYIRYPAAALVEALTKYSPVRQAGESGGAAPVRGYE